MSEEPKSRYELFLEEEARKAQPTRRCSKCKNDKSLSEFHKDKNRKYGLMYVCKECISRSNRAYKNQEDKFWKYYHSHTVNSDGCVEWTGGYHSGYPTYRWDNRPTVVRRIVYKLSVGFLEDEMYVFASCRNKRCVRHSHLKKINSEELQTIRSNNVPTGDKSGMRTHPESVRRGTSNGSSKINDKVVIEIRRMYFEDRISQSDIAQSIGIDQTTVSCIVTGKTWKHVNG